MDQFEQALALARQERQFVGPGTERRADKTFGGVFAGLRMIDHGAEATGLVLALRIVDEKDDKIIEVRALLVP